VCLSLPLNTMSFVWAAALTEGKKVLVRVFD